MRPTAVLLAAAASAPFASAARAMRKDMLIDPREQRPFPDLPIRVSDAGKGGFVHVQFPIACTKCFAADASKPRKNLQDGVLEVDFRITRQLGLDGDEGAQVNGYTVSDSAFPLRSEGDDNVAAALHLFSPEAAPGVPASVPVEGSISFDTIFVNATHDVKGVAYNLTKVGEVTPGAPTGFRLSFSRSPKNSILRIEQGVANIEGEAWPFEHPEKWIAVGSSDGSSEHFAWKKELDWLNKPHAGVYPGWDQDFVACKTTACRVNKVHTKVTKAYDECVERKERPDQFETDIIPPGCYVLLAGYYARRNMAWVGCGLIFLISQLMRRNLEKQKEKIQKAKKKAELDEQALERMEDDAVDYLMEVETKVQAAASTGAAAAGETVTSRKGHTASDE
ncbi:hypothetical protein UCRNP2_7210 [Neofusicoccum parvum UCRNP2]|uniref:Uncharacterized protein n=1 Tax=Botryosphaeria parva (strain UCR-NP2) TaxID=1287680 RepID=R1EF13_BOTPV|nr:hypothetical protein UCRNP2_7210 [Neofusicoccum parvum UCRNP2]